MKNRLHSLLTCNDNFSYLAAWAKDNKIDKVYFSTARYVYLRKISHSMFIPILYL